jgi:membrane protease YdiL (CAAX protease family)
MTRRQWAVALFAIVLVGYLAFRVIDTDSWPLESAPAEGLLKVGLWVVPCLLILRFRERVGYRGVWAMLGLGRGLARGYLFGLVATLPMLVVLANGPLGGSFAGAIGGVLLGPFAEEVLFRGLLFRQLHLRAGWTARRAMLVSALVFGLAHIGNVRLGGVESLVLAAGQVGATSAGGLLFAWIVYRWDSLWPAIGLHAFMNLWWDLSGAEAWANQTQSGATALGPQLANVARLASVALAIALTLRHRRGNEAMGQ